MREHLKEYAEEQERLQQAPNVIPQPQSKWLFPAPDS